MKKWLKLWITALAILWMMWWIITTVNNVEAATKNNSLTLTIWAFNGWVNTCTWSDYSFSATASTTEQTKNQSKPFSCAFWNSAAASVTLQMSWNMTWPMTITWGNIKLKNTEWSATPTTIKNGNTAISTYTAFDSTPAVLFKKKADTIWTWAWTAVDIQLTIPAWAPNGTYNWTIVLSY